MDCGVWVGVYGAVHWVAQWCTLGVSEGQWSPTESP
nr:MAG TPA: hypothetical protein [Caudoviricetes sp.]